MCINTIVTKIKKWRMMVFKKSIDSPSDIKSNSMSAKASATEMKNLRTTAINSKDTETKATTGNSSSVSVVKNPIQFGQYTTYQPNSKVVAYNKTTQTSPIECEVDEPVPHPNHISEIEIEGTVLTHSSNGDGKGLILCSNLISKIWKKNIFWARPTNCNVNGSVLPPCSVSQIQNSSATDGEVNTLVPQSSRMSKTVIEETTTTRPTDDDVKRLYPRPSAIFHIFKKSLLWTRISKNNVKGSAHHSSLVSEIHEGTTWAQPIDSKAHMSLSHPNPNSEVDTYLPHLTEEDFNDVEFIVCSFKEDGSIYFKGRSRRYNVIGLGDGEVNGRKESSFFDGEASFSYMVSHCPSK